MYREPGAGRLAQRERGTGMVDVVVGQDHPVEVLRLKTLPADEPKDCPVAAGVARVDNGQVVPAGVEIGLRAMDTGDPLDHVHIIGDIALPRWRASVRPVDPWLRNLERRRRRFDDFRPWRLRRQLRTRGIADLGESGIRDHRIRRVRDGWVARYALHIASLS